VFSPSLFRAHILLWASRLKLQVHASYVPTRVLFLYYPLPFLMSRPGTQSFFPHVEGGPLFIHVMSRALHYIASSKSWRTHERKNFRGGGLSSSLKVGAFIALPRIIQIFGRMLIPPPKRWHQKETTTPLTRCARSNLKNVLIYHVKCSPVFEYSIAVHVIHGENATLGEGMLKKETIQEGIF
jgi:hypothetical protein